MFVLRRSEDGAYVRAGGMTTSYSKRLQDAKTWATREEAEEEACGNEYVSTVENEMQRPSPKRGS